MRLSLFELRKNAVKNPLVCFLFIIGSVLSSLIFIYCYGNSFSAKIGGHALAEEYRGFELQLERKVDISEPDLALLDEFNIEEVEVSADLELSSKYKENLPGQAQPKICAYRDNFMNVSPDNPLFDKKNLSDNVIIVPKELSDFTSIQIKGVEFTVIGYTSSPEVFVVPMKIYVDYFQAETISYLCTEPLSYERIREVESILNHHFPFATISSPNNVKAIDRKEDTFAFVKMSILYITSLFSFLFLFKCMIDQSRRELTIYTLVGARKTTIFKLLVCEVMVLSLLAFLLAFVVHKTFYKSFFSQVNIMSGIEYSVGDYIFVLLTTVLLSMCAAAPFAYICCRSTVAQMKRYYNS